MTTPTQAPDVAEGLREAIRSIVDDALNSAIPEPWEVTNHATDRILARLSQEIAAMRKALEPFVQHYEPWMDGYPDDAQVTCFSRHTFGQLRAAVAALTTPQVPAPDTKKQ